MDATREEAIVEFRADSCIEQLAVVERPCRTCGAPVEMSPSTAAKSRLNPLCADCEWPERAAREDAEAVEFVVLLGDTAEELAAAVAALS